MQSLTKVYAEHHQKNRGRNFVLYEKERSDFIVQETKSGDLKILDIGCRDGALTKYALKNNNTVLGCDIDTDSLAHAKKLGVETLFMDLNGDWEELDGKTYDRVMAFEIIEHLYFPDKVLERVKKRLKPGGYLIGSLPNAFNWWSRLLYLSGRKKGTSLYDPTHINHFAYGELKSLLEKHFSEVTIYPLVPPNRLFLARLNPNLFSFGFMFKCRK